MNVFIRAIVTINLSPHENILTIALINIHYLYTMILVLDKIEYKGIFLTRETSLLCLHFIF